jgi:hypothetical protein
MGWCLSPPDHKVAALFVGFGHNLDTFWRDLDKDDEEA